MSGELTITIEFQEPEARLLASIVTAIQPHLSDAQETILAGIATKFADAGMEAINGLIKRHGLDGANAIAKSVIERHPEADEVRIG